MENNHKHLKSYCKRICFNIENGSVYFYYEIPSLNGLKVSLAS